MERIKRIFGREYGNVNQAALLLGAFAFLSQILGLFRDRAIAHFIGPSKMLDTYYAAFRIPDLIFISIASLFSITVLIPFILNKMKGGVVTQEARNLLNSIFTVFFISISVVSVVVFIFLPYLVPKITPGFDLEMQKKVVELSRIMLLSPIFLGLSNLFGSITQLFKKFFIYALSPILYNLGIIAGVFFLYPIFGIHGLAYGVVLGALFHFLVQVTASFHSGFKLRFVSKVDFSEIKKITLISIPRTLGLALNNIALIVIVSVASFLESGSISVFNLSLNLQSVPLGIIGLSYAVASFPSLSKTFASGEIDSFKKELKNAARNIIFWSLPVTFLFIVLRAQIVRTILGSGSFSWENTRLVAASVAIFSISIVAQGLIALFARVYYATGNTKKPLYVNLVSSMLIVIFSIVFVYLFKSYTSFRYFIESLFKVTDIPGTEVLMLPLAYSLGTIINFSVLWFFVKKNFMKTESFLMKSFFQSLGASFFIGFVAYLALNALSPVFGTETFWGVFLQGLISGVIGICAGILVLYFLKNEELNALAETLKTKFWNAKILVPGKEEL